MNSPSQPAEPLSGNQDNNAAPTGNTFDQSTVQPRRSRRASSVLAASNTASKRPGAPSSDSAQSTAVSKKPKRKQKRSRGQPLPQPATEKVTQKQILFTGLWDKTIKSWDVETQVLLSTSTGHIDFVKSIHIIPNLGLLVSGSTDRDIRLWDFKQSIESFDWSEIEAQCHAQRRAKIKANQSKTEQEIAAEDAIEDAPAGF
ncbi:hypothetical protein PtA15_2A89 [Puccinia triticina]|uniref:Uncharacterized protein n=1 Tax=Puccinia triticina TaxID=208348 RepID=A0ABY7CG41_9BASI|nr:uncharacterized protein PtA15_2A89 [Puccinia triticina]WAQ81777.1 hypothetical protein PtA15_2A89 [Puccinia triticina]